MPRLMRIRRRATTIAQATAGLLEKRLSGKRSHGGAQPAPTTYSSGLCPHIGGVKLSTRVTNATILAGITPLIPKFQREDYDCGQTCLEMLGYDGTVVKRGLWEVLGQ